MNTGLLCEAVRFVGLVDFFICYESPISSFDQFLGLFFSIFEL